jgi:hypothetical protein
LWQEKKVEGKTEAQTSDLGLQQELRKWEPLSSAATLQTRPLEIAAEDSGSRFRNDVIVFAAKH